MEHIVKKKITLELIENRVAGPFNQLPIQNFWVSSLGLVPKKALGKYWFITCHMDGIAQQVMEQT